MVKIYTKQGDKGETGLFQGARVPKDHLRIRTYGTLDELNAALGVVLTAEVLPAKAPFQGLHERLNRIQSELFQLGAELATPRDKDPGIALIEAPHTEALEKEIDEMEKQMPPLKTFVLPGGAAGSAYLHLARTISRRAERELASLHRSEPVRPEVFQYVNRLGDYLFVCARYANHLAGEKDVPWVSPAKG